MSRSERTQHAILDAAWHRLEVDGAARLEDIAADAGVTRQTVYFHFGSRAGLLVALVEHVDRELGLDALIAEVVAIDDPVEQLQATVTLTATYAPRVHGIAMAMYRAAASDPEIAAALENRMSHRRAGLRLVAERLRAAELLTERWTLDEVVDILIEAAMPSSYEHLVVDRGWEPDRFATWLRHLALTFVRDGTSGPGHASP